MSGEKLFTLYLNDWIVWESHNESNFFLKMRLMIPRYLLHEKIHFWLIFWEKKFFSHKIKKKKIFWWTLWVICLTIFLEKQGYKQCVSAQVGENRPTRTVFIHFQKMGFFRFFDDFDQFFWKNHWFFFQKKPMSAVKYVKNFNFLKKKSKKIFLGKKIFWPRMC